MAKDPPSGELVSVIITCYNQGQYLSDAIRSVQAQTYSPIEIVIVNDGSTDGTETVAHQFPGIVYVSRLNQGLASARNAGLRQCSGQYMVFLDADDILYPAAIAINLQHLLQEPDVTFVSGGHIKKDMATGVCTEEPVDIHRDHYLQLLQGNYIGMHAAVLYRRTAFGDALFDITLPVCEDYDLYLRIAQKKRVLHHAHPVAEYRLYANSLSANIPLMLQTVLLVLHRQGAQLKEPKALQAYQNGQRVWKDYYSKKIFQRLMAGPSLPVPVRKNFLRSLWRYRPGLYFRYLFTKLRLLSKPG